MSNPKFYTIEPYKPPMTPGFATAAMRECGICGTFVASSGGGGRRQLCPACVHDIETGNMGKFLIDRERMIEWRKANKREAQ